MKNKSKEISKEKIVLSMLTHVPYDGWNWNALYKGAEDIYFLNKKIDENIKTELRNLFNNNLTEIVRFLNDYLDTKMENDFLKLKLQKTSIPEKVKTLILLRLKWTFPYKDSIRLSLGFMGMPNNSKKSISMLYKTCDKIWRISGDTSTDFSFYTKRIVLSGLYTSTLLFWINDDSKDLTNTESFLARRLLDISNFGKIKKFSNKLLEKNTKMNKNSHEYISSLKKRFSVGNLFKQFKNFNQ